MYDKTNLPIKLPMLAHDSPIQEHKIALGLDKRYNA